MDPRTGALIRSVKIPSKRVTSVSFGGYEMDIIYVTTSRYGQTDQEKMDEPLAGSVFAVSCLGVKAQAPDHKIIRTRNHG